MFVLFVFWSPACGQCVVMIVRFGVPANVIDIILSVICTTSFKGFLYVLCRAMPTPLTWLGFSGFSPLKYHRYSCRCIIVFCFWNVSCKNSMWISCSRTQISISSYLPARLVPWQLNVPMCSFCSYAMLLALGGSWAVAWDMFLVVLL